MTDAEIDRVLAYYRMWNGEVTEGLVRALEVAATTQQRRRARRGAE